MGSKTVKDYSIKSIRDEFKSKGVFYTPKELGERLKSLADVDYKNVYDPTCGRGYLLSVFDDVVKYGQEIDEEALKEAKANLDPFIGEVGDTIKEDKFKDMKFDLIVANPPFSIKYEPTKELEEDERFKDLPCLAPASKADYMFIAHCLAKLKDGGQAIILNFPGILYRGAREYKIRKYLVDNNFIEKVIHIKGDTFVDTKIATCVLVLKRQKADNNVLFVDTENELEYLATYEEVIQNDYLLSVSAYAIQESEKEVIDPLDLQYKAHKNFKEKIIKELEFTRSVCEFEGLDFKRYVEDILNLVSSFLN